MGPIGVMMARLPLHFRGALGPLGALEIEAQEVMNNKAATMLMDSSFVKMEVWHVNGMH